MEVPIRSPTKSQTSGDTQNESFPTIIITQGRKLRDPTRLTAFSFFFFSLKSVPLAQMQHEQMAPKIGVVKQRYNDRPQYFLKSKPSTK
jgi:hypothetical protein